MSDIYPITLARYNDLYEARLIDANQMYQIYSTEEDIAQELISTRKALKIAVDWLKQVATPEQCDDELCREFTKRKLSQITALMQGGKNE